MGQKVLSAVDQSPFVSNTFRLNDHENNYELLGNLIKHGINLITYNLGQVNTFEFLYIDTHIFFFFF